nr:MAG TPA: hypothetical protein [Caudoviricetes sp.]
MKTCAIIIKPLLYGKFILFFLLKKKEKPPFPGRFFLCYSN